MKTISKDKRQTISTEELSKYYKNQSKMEQDIRTNRAKVMEHQLNKVTGGKMIVVSNCSK